MTDSPRRGDRTARNAEALATGVAALGLDCAIEARGGLALILPAAESVAKLAEDETRRAVLALAKQHGFTHVAIELPSDRRRDRASDAPVSRD
jgi:hypothetical protein